MAGHQFLNQLSAQVRLDAVETIQALLRSSAGDEDESEAGREQEALMHATRDVVAKTDASFQVNALVAALARIEGGQAEVVPEHPDEFEVALRTWSAQEEITTACRGGNADQGR